MILSKEEKEFLASIENKINTYDIKISLKDCISIMNGVQAYTTYNDKSQELVDTAIEIYLVKNSFSYFINKYGKVDIPGLGTVPMNPYYFQSEMAKEIHSHRKIVLDKTRQCLTEDCYIKTKRGFISIKNVKPGDMVETLINNRLEYTLIEDFFIQRPQNVIKIKINKYTAITCTLDHKIMTENGWVESGNLSVGDSVVCTNGIKEIKEIEVIKEKQTVYDITTSSNTFLSNGILVHNCGMSTIFALYAFWKAHFFEAESIDIVSTKQTKAQQFVKKIFSTMESLPEWMKTPIKSQNQQRIVFQHNSGSVSEIVSESQSENAGRGDSLSVLILDEVAFYQSEKMVRQIVASAQPTLNKTGGQMIMISTPNGTSGRGAYYYEQVIQARSNEKGTRYLDIDWWEIPDDPRIGGPRKSYNHILEKAIKEGYYYKPEIKRKYKEYFDPIARETYRDNEWLKASFQDLGDSTYRQEILHEFIIAGDKVFNEEVLKKVEEKLKDPIRTNKFGSEQIDGWWVWKDPVPGHRYILAIDCGSGTGSDYSSIEVIDVGEYEQVAEYKGFISTPNFSRLIKRAAKLYNEGYVIIESNSIGEAVFNGVYYSENDPYNNVYKQKKIKNGVSRYTGWITDVKSRKLIANDFIDWITVDTLWEQIKIYSKRLWLEMNTWIWTDGGKADHSQGCHDDCIFAFAIGIYNRNKAVTSGESFIIDEKGRSISADDDFSDVKTSKTNSFGVMSSEDRYDDEDYIEKYGIDKDEYNWLIK